MQEPIGIFSKIVQHENDLIGYVAYCIYKKAKIEHCKTFELVNNEWPSDQVRETIRNSFVPRIEELREKATILVTQLTEEVYGTYVDETAKEILDVISQKIDDKEVAIRGDIKTSGSFTKGEC